ncbi:MAG: hypothetical protein QM764_13110 [Chitinophagaceae bacterium]
MKLLFFLAALILVSLRAWFLYDNRGGHNDDKHGTVTISIGDHKVQYKWFGKIALSDDERTIKSIQPGGYLKFKENDIRMSAESNVQGEITYSLYDGEHALPLNDSGRSFIASSLRKMIDWGFNSSGRAKRIYQQEGYKALMEELPRLKMQDSKAPYLELLLSSDSLQKHELAMVIRQTASALSDADKENFLHRIPLVQLKDSTVSNAWLNTVASINADVQKVNLLTFMIERDSLDTEVFSQIMNITNQISADVDKQTIYRKLVERTTTTEQQFVALIDAAGRQNADVDKSNLLVLIAGKMPHTEKTKSAYLSAAKKINNDGDYGRAVKFIE